jgi:PAS domain S-box-containing protein
MFWLIPSIIATMAGTALLSFTYWYLYSKDRQRHLAAWALSWSVCFIRYALMLWMLESQEKTILLIGNQWASLLSGVLLLWGTYQFVDKKLPAIWTYGCGFGALWIAVSVSWNFSFLLTSIPTFTFLAIVYIWTGITLINSVTTAGYETRATGWAFIIWGIHKANYPFLRPVVWFAPWGYLFAALLETMVALGMLLAYFQKTRIMLRASEKNYRSILENAVEGFYQSNPEGHFISVNPAFVSMFGYDAAEELVSRHFDIKKQFYDNPEDRLRWEKVLQKNGAVKNFEFKAKRKDGTHFWACDSTRAIFDENGQIIRYEGNVFDIDQRKRSEKELLQRNQFIETILDNLPIGLATNFIDRGKVTYINNRFEEIYGWSKQELDSFDSFFEKVYPDKAYRERVKARVLADIQSGDPRRMEWEGAEVTGKDGQKRIIYAKNIPIPEQNLMISTVQDITERKNLQMHLQKAQKMEAIGNLAGGIAHDFNNILSPIIGYAEILMEELPAKRPEHEYAQEIFIAGKRGSDLVKQILAFSRQSEPTFKPVHMQQVLKEVLKLSRSTIPADIKIVDDLKNDCKPVLADATQLHQIAMNLITNAYHAVEPAGGQITVRLKESHLTEVDADAGNMEPGCYALLTVADTGCGIDPAIISRIFDPYFTTKEQGKGTGLGLAVVYGIVKKHGGDIRVQSTPGKGTTFEVLFPQIKKDCLNAVLEKSEKLENGSERILLVDDEEPIAKLEKQMLERLGYHVTMRTSSIEALAAFKARPDAFDLVVSDMTMPNMTGDRLAREMTSIRPDMSVILCTGFSERLNRKSARAAGIKGLLMKPVVRSDMARMVRNVLDEGRPCSC